MQFVCVCVCVCLGFRVSRDLASLSTACFSLSLSPHINNQVQLEVSGGNLVASEDQVDLSSPEVHLGFFRSLESESSCNLSFS
jgi:hypothetical protein